MSNLINLIDGVDGLAGGISLMLMALLAYVGHQNGDFELLAPAMPGASSSKSPFWWPTYARSAMSIRLMPPASPSTPSMRLIRLLMPTSQRIVSQTTQLPRLTIPHEYGS